MLSERLQTTMDMKNFMQCYLILLEVLEITDNNAHEKVLSAMLPTLGTTLHRSESYAMLSKQLQTILHKENHVQRCLNTPKTTIHKKKYRQCCLVTQFTQICQILHVKKIYDVILLLWKLVNQLNKAETTALHSTQQPIKLLVRHCLNK